ncbi:MAG: ExeM/NucH family extracellular endonuclease [Actinomycetaceae bacterium]|nr:ExeM/NucH family extracellular endonuclease [Actinomycetaceae bacterium]
MVHYSRRRRSLAVVATSALALTGLFSASSAAFGDDSDTLVEITPIAEIQGTGMETPFDGQVVTTRGVVTASYPTGGFSGYYIQTPGTGGTVKTENASDGIFVYPGRSQPIVEVGKCVTITGTAGEYNDLTQISRVESTVEEADCEPVTPFELNALPATDEEREEFEGMLLQPLGAYTVTDNYSLNRYGTIGLAFGTEALAQPTDVVAPGEPAIAYEIENLKKSINLDDGSNWDYTRRAEAQNSPLPYLTADQPVRVGAPVSFTGPVILDYRFGWNFQPQQQVIGLQGAPASFGNTRTPAPAPVGGDITVATFNVLNFFTALGEDEADCKGYPDREGNPITTNWCDARGAYRAEDFERQHTKITAAINALDADIVSLEEIENSSRYGKDRDEALSVLVDLLNAAAGEDVWAFVPSPQDVPNDGDAIRTAYIYKPASVAVIGESVILNNRAFDGVARSPLAQRFAPIVGENEEGTEFTLIVNHFKSKGSLLEGDENADKFDGQGNNNGVRVRQAAALAEFADTFDGPTFLVGDFNSYSMEDPMTTLAAAGYTIQGAGAGDSYMYSGRVGSLDHVVANEAGAALIEGVSVWEINAHEPIALEYSRFNSNVTNFYTPDAYRSSDHNPEIFGLNVITVPEPEEPVDPEQPGDPGDTQSPGASDDTTPPATDDSSSSDSASSDNGGAQLPTTGVAVTALAIMALLAGAAGGVFLLVRRQSI